MTKYSRLPVERIHGILNEWTQPVSGTMVELCGTLVVLGRAAGAEIKSLGRDVGTARKCRADGGVATNEDNPATVFHGSGGCL